jgi:hypothetical protein
MATYSLWNGDDQIAANVFGFSTADYPGGGVAIWHVGNYDPAYPDVIYAPGTWTHILKGEDNG